MQITIRPTQDEDLAAYTSMMQETYEDAYTDDSIGLTKDCFSKQVFSSKDTQNYLQSKLLTNDKQKSWVALNGNRLVGAISIEDKGLECELTGFYVLPTYQGHGIGKRLWLNAVKFSKDKDMTLDIYVHNKKSIQLYEHWGFKEDKDRDHFYRHWPEWPEGLQAESMYMQRHLAQKILLTGHLGYLGTQFMHRFGADFEIIGYDLKEGDDILDFDNLKQKMKGCEQVVHLAAIPKPVEGKSFDDYFRTNVEGTRNVARAAAELGLKRIIYASSTTVYGVEQGIPFSIPIRENHPTVSQYISADQLSCRDVDLSYHMSKVMAEQIIAWYGLNKKIQTTALRFGPIGKVFLGTSVSDANAAQAIKLAIKYSSELWYEPFSIVDDVEHIDTSKAKETLGYRPEQVDYPADKIRSSLTDRKTL